MFVIMQDERIKVLFISSWFPNRVKPTASKFILRHAEAISLYAVITVLHVCFDKNNISGKFEIVEEKKGEINIIFIYVKPPSTIFNKFLLYLKAYKKGLKMVTEKYGKPDIIHANVLFPVGLAYLFLKSFRKIPAVFTEHWSGYLPENALKIVPVKKYLIKKIAGKASTIMPVSVNLKKAMMNLRIKGNYQVIPNTVNIDKFSEYSQDIPANKKLLHISSLQDSAKNISGILRVIKKLSVIRQDFSLHFISNGNQKPFIELSENLTLLNKHVFFHEGKRTEEIAAIMQQSDIFILFSNYENLPCVILEALSCGLPVIATDTGDISRYVSEKFGIIIKPGDEEALLYAIDKMLDDLEKYDRKLMHEFAVNNFSYEVVGKNFYDIYVKTLDI
jgi:L-malate glycosyltransferase